MNASVSAARGIVRAIWVSWIAGFVLLAGLTFAIQDYAGTQASATGVPPAQILIDALGTSGATAMLLIVIAAQLFCGNAEVAAASRMVFAFSRDNALPGSALWRKHPRHGSSTNCTSKRHRPISVLPRSGRTNPTCSITSTRPRKRIPRLSSPSRCRKHPRRARANPTSSCSDHRASER